MVLSLSTLDQNSKKTDPSIAINTIHHERDAPKIGLLAANAMAGIKAIVEEAAMPPYVAGRFLLSAAWRNQFAPLMLRLPLFDLDGYGLVVVVNGLVFDQ